MSQDTSALTLIAAVYSASGEKVWEETNPKQLPESHLAIRFVELFLIAADGTTVLDRNVYWLPSDDARDEFDFQSSSYSTVTQYAKLEELNSLPMPNLMLADEIHSEGQSSVTVKNVDSTVAFFIRLRLVGDDNRDIVPAFWSDNFVTLFDGQHQNIVVKYSAALSGTKKFVVEPFNAELK